MKHLIVLCILVSAACAQNITALYVPNSPFFLGRGVDANLPVETKEWAFSAGIEEYWADTAGVMELVYTSHFVDSVKDASELIQIDTAVAGEAKFGDYSGKLNAAEKTILETTSHSQDITYVVKATYDFGRKAVRKMNYTDAARNLIEQKRFDDFIARFGSHYVGAQHHNAYVLVTVKIQNLTKTSREQIIRSLKGEGSGTYDGITGTATASRQFDRAISEAYKLGTVEASFRAQGGDPRPIGGFGVLTFDQISATIKSYMEGITQDKSVPVMYTLIPYPELPPRPLNAKRREFFRAAYERFLQLMYTSEGVSEDMARLRAIDGRLVNLYRLQASHQDATLAMSSLLSKVQDALRTGDFDVSTLPVLPSYSAVFDILKNARIEVTPKYTTDGFLEGAGFVLFASFSNPELIVDVEYRMLGRAGAELESSSSLPTYDEKRTRFMQVLHSFRQSFGDMNNGQKNAFAQKNLATLKDTTFLISVNLLDGRRIVEQIVPQGIQEIPYRR
jgi:hypothetical protein